MIEYHFDWSDMAFGSKKPLKELKAIFIAAPRKISSKRFVQIVKEYLPKGNILLGISKEPYVAGYEEQPQFEMAALEELRQTIAQVNKSKSPHKIYTLTYFQREQQYILEKIPFKLAVFINGSWRHMFHVSPSYYALMRSNTPYELTTPFADEPEAISYAATIDKQLDKWFYSQAKPGKPYSEIELLRIASQSAFRSFDYVFQTGVALGKAVKGKPGAYEFLASGFNKVVPFQSFAMHYGSVREKNFSPPNDLNHYDTVHAEVNFLVEAQKAKLDLGQTTLFINLMPCPSCARMFSETDIPEFVYTLDHSNGYAIQMLERAGKKVRRVVPPEEQAK